MTAQLSFVGLALWLVPPSSSVASNLSGLISSLAERYRTSAFLPHITLFSGILRHAADESEAGSSELGPADEDWTREIVERVQEAVDDWKGAGRHHEGVYAAYDKLGTKPTPFQYLYVQIRKSHPLVELHQSLARRFVSHGSASIRDVDIGADRSATKLAADYFPHLSLMYGSDCRSPPRNSRQIIASLIEDGLATSPPDPTSTQVSSDGEKCTIGGESGFSGLEIVVMDCEGPVSGWRELGRVSLAN